MTHPYGGPGYPRDPLDDPARAFRAGFWLGLGFGWVTMAALIGVLWEHVA